MNLLFIYMGLTLGFSFLCSVAEATLLSLTSPYVSLLEKQGKPAGILLRHFKDNINRPLAAILTLNTIANTVGAASVGVQAAEVFGHAAVGIASGILTLLILVFSEIIPKTLGALYWRQLAPAVAYFLKYLVYFLYPFVLMAEFLTKMLARDKGLSGLSREEFSVMADLGAKEGQLEAGETRILKNLFRFRHTHAKDIMTPRTVLFCLPQELSVGEYFTQHAQKPFSRIPVYQGSRDEITGFVLSSDLLIAKANHSEKVCLSDFRREIHVVPVQADLLKVFDFLIKSRAHMVLVVDEYGTLQGIVTLEDVLETLLGFEIVDENDKNIDMQWLARDLWKKRAQAMGLVEEKDKSQSTPSNPSLPTNKEL